MYMKCCNQFPLALFKKREAFTAPACMLSKRYSLQLLPTQLTTEDREKSLQPLLTKDWKIVDEKDAIEKTFKFKNFNQAFGFMTRIAMASEKLDHHPDWSNVYNSVTILWTTHCSGGITVNDIKMATFCETIYSQSMGSAAKV